MRHGPPARMGGAARGCPARDGRRPPRVANRPAGRAAPAPRGTGSERARLMLVPRACRSRSCCSPRAACGKRSRRRTWAGARRRLHSTRPSPCTPPLGDIVDRRRPPVRDLRPGVLRSAPTGRWGTPTRARAGLAPRRSPSTAPRLTRACRPDDGVHPPGVPAPTRGSPATCAATTHLGASPTCRRSGGSTRRRSPPQLIGTTDHRRPRDRPDRAGLPAVLHGRGRTRCVMHDDAGDPVISSCRRVQRSGGQRPADARPRTSRPPPSTSRADAVRGRRRARSRSSLDPYTGGVLAMASAPGVRPRTRPRRRPTSSGSARSPTSTSPARRSRS